MGVHGERGWGRLYGSRVHTPRVRWVPWQEHPRGGGPLPLDDEARTRPLPLTLPLLLTLTAATPNSTPNPNPTTFGVSQPAALRLPVLCQHPRYKPS